MNIGKINFKPFLEMAKTNGVKIKNVSLELTKKVGSVAKVVLAAFKDWSIQAFNCSKNALTQKIIPFSKSFISANASLVGKFIAAHKIPLLSFGIGGAVTAGSLLLINRLCAKKVEAE